MLYHAILFSFLILKISAGSFNSFHKQTPTEKPDILLEDPLVPKSLNPPTHISEFTDPDTGLNPFLDLEEGPTLIGRNVMKDETRQDPPFVDFEMVEGEGSSRRWLDLDLPKEPLEESIPRWIPFEEDAKLDKKFPPLFSSQQTITTTIETTNEYSSVLLSTIPDEIDDIELSVDSDKNVITEPKITVASNSTIIYASATVVIIVLISIFLLGICWWKRRKATRTRSPVSTLEKGELNC